MTQICRFKRPTNALEGTSGHLQFRKLVLNDLLPFYFQMAGRISLAILIIFSTFSFLLLGFSNSVSAQNMTNMTNQMNNNSTTQEQHAEHVLDNLVTSEHIPLRGQLYNGDYILLMDLTPFATSVQGHSHIAMKVPCNEDGSPKVTIVTGVAPKLNPLDIGRAISNGSLNGKYLDLSAEGRSCLYHAELPNGTTDIALVNTSNRTLSFDEGAYYSVTITVHGTAIQHLASDESG